MEQHINCVCATSGPGKSFCLQLDELAGVEWFTGDPHGETGAGITLVTRDGERHWLTTRFGNPASDFAEKICELRPVVDQRGGVGITMRIRVSGESSQRRSAEVPG